MKDISAWKPVKGFEDKYRVSRTGEVFSLERKVVLNTRINEINGYPYVMLCSRSKKVRHYIHRLVAEAYIEKKDPKFIVNHLNGIKTDNRVENLEWCSYGDNNRHAYRIGLKKPIKTTAANIKARKRVVGYSDVLGTIEFESTIDAKRNGFGHVSECINGRLKTCGGYRWEVRT